MSEENFTAGLFKLRFKALGTNCILQYRAASVSQARAYRTAALEWIREFEATWSRFREESLLCEINRQAGKKAVKLTPKQDHVISLCAHTFELSGGLLDPTSFPLTKLWEKADRIPSEDEIMQARELISWEGVEYSPGNIYLPKKGMALEIGGFGKEYAVDQLIELARVHEITSALVDLGRDVATLGSPPGSDYWVVGVENAQELDAPLHRLALSGQGLATSGNGRRFREIEGETFGHILDHRTGRPAVTDLETVSCLAPDCLTAGIFATSTFLRGSKEGLIEIDGHLKVEALLQESQNTLYSSKIHQLLLS